LAWVSGVTWVNAKSKNLDLSPLTVQVKFGDYRATCPMGQKI
jgi:hypothetical protein